MCRSHLILLLCLIMLFSVFFSGRAYCGENELTLLSPEQQALRGPVLSGNLDELDELFTIPTYLTSAEYYLGAGALGDTFGIVIEPLTACSIYVVRGQFYTDGEIEVYIWEYNPACQSLFPSGVAPERGTTDISPLGQCLYGPEIVSVDGTQYWETLVEFAPGEAIFCTLEESPCFVVGFVKLEEEGYPYLLASNVTDRGETRSWFSGPWLEDYEEPWGAYSSNFDGGTLVEYMLQASVVYAGYNPPQLYQVTQLPNTTNPHKFCEVKAQFFPMNPPEGVSLHCYCEDSDTLHIQMFQVGDSFNWTGYIHLDAFPAEAGDNITYWVEYYYDVYRGFSGKYEFSVVELDAASILVIDAFPQQDVVNPVMTSLSDAGFSTVRWSTEFHHGLDRFLLSDNHWEAVFVFGQGYDAMVTREYSVDDAYVDYLVKGGNLLYVDVDYFYCNNEGEEPEFEVGDYAYDFFGISQGRNDPLGVGTVMTGVLDDPVSGTFYIQEYILADDDRSEWSDYLYARNGAVPIFYTSANNCTGIRHISNEFGCKTVYLSFDALEATPAGNAEPSPQMRELLANITSWFDVTDVSEDQDQFVPSDFFLVSGWPNPFNSELRISFALPDAQPVTVNVYDLHGRKVTSLFRGVAQGTRQLSWRPGTELASGVYFIRLEAEQTRLLKVLYQK